jgi:hypothetical protein
MIPATIVAIGCVTFLPTSPRWLVQHGQMDEARAVMLYLRQGVPAEEVHAELVEIQLVIEAESQSEGNWSDLLLSGIWQRVVAAVGLVFFQQFCGINSIVTFGNLFFETAGLAGQRAVIGNLLCDTANLLGTFILLLVIDKLGRRFLLQLSACVMLVGWVGCAVLNRLTEGPNPSQTMGWLMVGCVMLFEFGFGLGYGAIAWVYPSEIFPFSVKNKGMSVMVFAEYASNFALAVGFPVVQKAIGTEQVAFVFAIFCAISIVFVHFWVPETKGLSLELMDTLFGDGYKNKKTDGDSYETHKSPGKKSRSMSRGLSLTTISSSSCATEKAPVAVVHGTTLMTIP